MKKLLYLFFALWIPLTLTAQTNTVEINGKVIDAANGNGLPGQLIIIRLEGDPQDTTLQYENAVQTDSIGRFIDQVPIYDQRDTKYRVSTIDCNDIELVQTVEIKVGADSIGPPIEFFVCTGIKIDCFADFFWEPDPQAPFTFMFFNNSVGEFSKQSWLFPDGTVYNDFDAIHEFPGPGVYEVLLAIGGENDPCKDTTRREIFIHDPDKQDCFVAFNVAPTPDDTLKLIFDAFGSPNLTDFFWDFGDGTQGQGRITEHSFPQDGPYAVSLLATDNKECEVSFNDTIFLPFRPHFDCFANFSSVHEGQGLVAFQNFSNTPDSTELVFEWNFGDGSFSDEAEPVHFYQSFGVYEVCLKVKGKNGCESFFCEKILVAGENILDCIASFQYNYLESSGDKPFTYEFISTSQGEFDSLEWHFGPEIIKNDSIVIFDFPGDGIYHVGLVVFNELWSCWDTAVQEIIVGDGFKDCFVGFGFNPDPSEPGKIFFEAYHSPGMNEFVWDFGDGRTEEGRFVEHYFEKEGLFQVCIKGIDDRGCEAFFCDTLSLPLDIPNACYASFVYEPLDDSTYEFFSFVEGGANEESNIIYQWDFGDGMTSTDANPIHTYRTNGFYEVCLNVYIGNICETVFCEGILVSGENIEGCLAAFEFVPDTTNGDSFSFRFLDRSEGDYTEIEWFFGPFAQIREENPVFTFPGDGVYDVGLLIYNENWTCWDSTVKEIVVGKGEPECRVNFEAFPSPEGPLAVHFEAFGAPVLSKWSWDFGDGTEGEGRNPDHVYNAEGSYWICLKAEDANGCIAEFCDSIFVPIQFGPPCFVEFDYEPIEPGFFHFFSIVDTYSQSDSLSFEWHFGDGIISEEANPEHGFEEFGAYEVCLRVSDNQGCESTYCDVIVVADENKLACLAKFDYAQADSTDPFKIQFFNQSEGEYTAQRWFFGDGNRTEEADPVYVFPGEGIFKVGLLIYNDIWNCWDSTIQEVKIGTGGGDCEIEFRFFPDPSDPMRVLLEADGTSQIVRWKWDFGNGSKGKGRFIQHRYAEPGVYEICLTGESDENCIVRRCIQISLPLGGGEPYCAAGFSSKQVDGLNFQFLNHSEWDKANHGAEFRWDFGDGKTSTLRNPLHEYEIPGAYEVCLRIITSDGCQDKACNIVVAADTTLSCIAEYDIIQDNSAERSFRFVSNSVGEFTNLVWFFGDGERLEQIAETLYTYEEDGLYLTGLLIHNDDWTCWDSASTPLQVGEAPLSCNSWFKVRPDTSGLLTVNLIGESDSDVSEWYWEFGDGTTGEGASQIHNYQEAGEYTICLTTVTAEGCKSVVCDRIKIPVLDLPQCKAAFNIASIGKGVYYFDNESRASRSGQKPTYEWSFGDGTFEQTENPVHSYLVNGTYLVRLVITDTEGCVDTAQKVINVESAIEEDKECNSRFYYFTDGTNSGRTINFISDVDTKSDSVSYFWDFGDGASSIAANPSHIYPGAGTYTCCLVITDSEGCEHKYCEAVFIEEVGEETYSLSGKVYLDENYADAVKVYLVTLDISSQYLYAIDSLILKVEAGDSACYQFSDIPTGFYLTQAELLLESNFYEEYVPTYFGGKLFWKEANFVPMFTDRTDIDIYMVPTQNPGGSGVISGNIFQGSNKNGQGAKEVQLILLDEEGIPVAYTFSDENGEFTFENIPFGNYTIYGELLNTETEPVAANVDESNPNAEDVDLEIVESLITAVQKEIPTYFDNVGKVYPSPVTGEAFISVSLVRRANVSLSLVNELGQILDSWNEELTAGEHRLSMNLSAIPAGTYILQISADGIRQTARRVVKY